MEKENNMSIETELRRRLEENEAVNITFTKKDGTMTSARVIKTDPYEAKTDRVKVEPAEGTIRLFCEERGRYITAQIDTIIF